MLRAKALGEKRVMRGCAAVEGEQEAGPGPGPSSTLPPRSAFSAFSALPGLLLLLAGLSGCSAWPHIPSLTLPHLVTDRGVRERILVPPGTDEQPQDVVSSQPA